MTKAEFALYRRVQSIAKDTIAYAGRIIRPGMSLRAFRRLCEEHMRALGADSFWYWEVGAFVFAGDETAVSVSGRNYVTSDRLIAADDIVTVDLSPQIGDTWGDYARTIILRDGAAADADAAANREWKEGLLMEESLHRELLRVVRPSMTFEELHRHMNGFIESAGFVNLDFAGNLGHSIVRRKEERVYIEQGSRLRFGDAELFTFEPHIGLPGSRFGYKMENIYYFECGVLQEL